MRKSSSGRHRAGSEASSRSERPRHDDQDPSKARSGADAMTTSSSRRKPSRGDQHEDRDATYATTITDEPSQISDRSRNDYRNDSRIEPEPNDTRRRSSKTDRSANYERSRGDKADNDSRRSRKEDNPRDSHKSNKINAKDGPRSHRNDCASLPQNQFPGEFPSTYSQPYRPPGLAAEYYGDNGESVAFQPGVRPNAPNIVTSAEQAHLLEPTIEAKPPPEPSSMGQVGAAASYFSNANYGGDIGPQTTPPKPPQKPTSGFNKPPKLSHYGVSPRASPTPQGNHAQLLGLAPDTVSSFPASGSVAIGAAAEYYAGGGGGISTSAYQTPNRPPHGSQNTSTPYSAPSRMGGSLQHSNAALYGGSAALAGAATGAYISGHSHHQHSFSQHQPSTNMGGLTSGYALSQGTQTHHAHRHKHQGLFGRFIDWWRDPDAVARFEEYTETIGVCKYCFDPMSSPADAPRRHDYRRRRPSPGSRYGSTTRVDKPYRRSSDEDLRRHSSAKKKVIAGGLTGYAAATLGEAVVNQKHGFDDTDSVKSGRPVNQSRVSFQEEQKFQRYQDGQFERQHSRHRAGRGKISSAKEGRRNRRSSSSSSTSSNHRISRGAALSAGVGAAGLAAGAATLGRKSRRRSQSRSRSPSSKRKYFSKRVSPMHSYVDLSTTNDGPGGLMGFFTSPSANTRKGKKPKGLFSFSNASSSSSDADLRFGEGTIRRKVSKKRLRERYGRQDRDNSVTAMKDLVDTGVALADEAGRRDSKGRRNTDADKHTGPGVRLGNGRRSSLADHQNSCGRDDEWYDIDGEVDSETSVDTALAYGGGLSAAQSRERLSQGGLATMSDYNFREEEQRQYQNSLGQQNFGRGSSFPRSTVETAAVAGVGGPLGGWIASNAVSQESNHPPTHGLLDPMQELDPRPISDPPSKGASSRATRVSSTSVPLRQPQPTVPVAPFINHNILEGIQAEEETRARAQREPSPVPQLRQDSNQAKLPSQGSRPGVNFNLSDEQLENEGHANNWDRRWRGTSGENNRRTSADAAVLMETTRKPVEPLRDQTGSRPRNSSEASGNPLDTDKRVAEINRELEKLYQEHQKAEERKRKESGLKKIVEGAVIGSAIVVAADSLASKDKKSGSREDATPTRKSSLKKTREKDPSPPPETLQERIARTTAQRVRSTSSPVHHDDYSTFFVPAELKEHLKENNDKAEHRDDFGATVVEIVPGAPKPSSSHPFDPFTYRQFGLELDDDPLLYPWPVPILGLIEPTPPGSRVHSIKGDETPVIEPKSKESQEDISEPLERKESKVTWGDHDTYIYQVETPEYERSDYGPEPHIQGDNPADVPSPKEVTEEPISGPGERERRPSVGRAWTLDEKEAEKLEKQASYVDDRPQISRAWTVDDKEADEIAKGLLERQRNDGSSGTTTRNVIKDESNAQDSTASLINPGPEEQLGDSFSPKPDQTIRTQTFYQNPFAETVSDLGIIAGYPATVQHDTKSQTILALENRDERTEQDLHDNENTSSGVRMSKSDRRRPERPSSFVDAFKPPPSQQTPPGPSEDISQHPLPATDSKPDLVDNNSASGSSALGLGLGASILLAADQVMKDNTAKDGIGSVSRVKEQPSRPRKPSTFNDSKSQRSRSGSRGGYHSDPEEWERLREKAKSSKSGPKSDVGVKASQKSKDRGPDDDVDIAPLRRARTDDDLNEKKKSGRSSRHSNGNLDKETTTGRSKKDEEKELRGKHRRDSDGHHDGDNRFVTSSTTDSKTKREFGGLFSSLFSSNKSDVSTSSKKSSKSSKSDSQADRERYDKSESRRKRRSKDREELDDVTSAVSEPSGGSRRGWDRQTGHIDQRTVSDNQTVDDGFVSAEETAETPIKDTVYQESFLGSRPEMPQPMVTDTPMGTDGVLGPVSERQPSSRSATATNVHTGGTVIPPEADHVDAPPAPSMEGDQLGIMPNKSPPGVDEEVENPEADSSPSVSHFTACRRLSAIRTSDIPSSPMVSSSPTAVPLHFRRPPMSPTNPRFSMSSPVMSPSSPLTTPRTRQGRPKSTEFRSSKEFRPLYLVERQNFAKTATSELAEEYPSLPSSKTSSAHPSMEDLRAEAQFQGLPDPVTPSRISAEMFRDRGRRHSYSYWHDNEKRRESPDYLDSRSATPVPGDAQKAREQEKKPKPKYEFHSPSELLQDPALIHDVAPVDEEVGPQSPLPSVASSELEQDYMSARSRSLSPTGSRSHSRGRRSASITRLTSVAGQDGFAAAAAGALITSATAAAAAHQVLKESPEDITTKQVETPRKSQFSAEEFTAAKAEPEREAINIEKDGDPASSQQPTQEESIQTAVDLRRDLESQVPSEAAVAIDAWQNVFAEIRQRNFDPEKKAEETTTVNTEEPKKPPAGESVLPSTMEGIALTKPMDGCLSDPGNAAESTLTNPEKVKESEEELIEGHEANFHMPATADEPFHTKQGLDEHAEHVGDLSDDVGLQMEGVEDVALGSSDDLEKSEDGGDKNEDNALLAFNEVFPPTSQGSREQDYVDVDIQDTEESGAPSALDMHVVADDLASGSEEIFEDAPDTQPTQVTLKQEPETPAELEAVPSVNIEEHVPSGQAMAERSLAEDERHSETQEIISDTAQPSLDPLEEAFKQAMEARGLTEGATVEAAYQAFQPEIPDTGGTNLSTIREEGDPPGPLAEQGSGPIERETDTGRSKRDKRKEKKGKKAAMRNSLLEPDFKPAEVDQDLQSATEERQDVKTTEPISYEDGIAETTPVEEPPNPFGNDFEIKPSGSETPPSGIKTESTIHMAAGVEGGEVPSSSMPEDDSSVPGSKKSKKGKKEKRKQRQTYNWDEAETGVEQTRPGGAAQVTEPAVQQQPGAMPPSNEHALPTPDIHDEPEIAITYAEPAQQESEDLQEMGSKPGKRKKSKKKKSVPVVIEETTGSTSQPPAVAALPSEPQLRTDEAADVSSQTRVATFTEQEVQEPVAIEESQASLGSSAPRSVDLTSAVGLIDPSLPIAAPEVAEDETPQGTESGDTQLNNPPQNDKSNDSALDVTTALDSPRAEDLLTKQQPPEENPGAPAEESEAERSPETPTDLTVPVGTVSSRERVKEDFETVDASTEPIPKVGVVQDEEPATHLGLEFEAIPITVEGEQVSNKPQIAALTPPEVAGADHTEELRAVSEHDQSPVQSQGPIEETSVEELIAQEIADVQHEATSARTKEAQAIRDGSGSKKKSKKLKKDKKKRQIMIDDVVGTSEIIGVDNDKHFPELTQDQVEGAGITTLLEGNRKAVEDLRLTDVKGSSDVEGQRARAVQPQSVTVLPTEIVEKNDIVFEPGDLAVEYNSGPQISSDTEKTMPSASESVLDKLLDEASRSVDTTEAEAEVYGSSAAKTVAKASVIGTPSAEIHTAEFPVATIPPTEIAALESSAKAPIEAAAGLTPQLAGEPTPEPATDPSAEPAAELAPELDTEPTTKPTTESAIESAPEPAADPTAELTTGPAPELTTESTPEVATEPNTKSGPEPTPEPAIEPTTEPGPELTPELAAEHTTERGPEPSVGPFAETAREPATESTIEPVLKLIMETAREVATEPTTEPTREATIEAPCTNSDGPTTEPIVEAIAGTAYTSVETSDEVGAEASSEVTIEPTASAELTAVAGNLEPMTEEDLGLPSKRSKEERKNKKTKRQSTLTAESIQPEPPASDKYEVTNEPEPIYEKSTLPEVDVQGTTAIIKGKEAEDLASMSMTSKGDKKKKQQSTRATDLLPLETVGSSSGKSTIDSKSVTESPTIQTMAEGLEPALEQVTESGQETVPPEFDIPLVEGESENIQEENTISVPTKSKKDKKKKKRQSNIEFVSPKPVLGAPTEEASRSTTNNVAQPCNVNESGIPGASEDLSVENGLTTPGDQAEEVRAPPGKNKKNKKRSRKLTLDETGLPRDGEQVGPDEARYIESGVENEVGENISGLSENQATSGAAEHQLFTFADAEERVPDASTEEVIQSQLKELDSQPQAAERVEELGKTQGVSEHNNSNVELLPQGESELLSIRDRDVSEMTGPLVVPPEEDLTIFRPSETASVDQMSGKSGISHKKAKKEKKKARRSASKEAEGNEASETLMENDGSSRAAPEATQPDIEREWSTSQKSNSKNSKRKSRPVTLDTSFAESVPSMPEVESAHIERPNEAVPQAPLKEPEVVETMACQTQSEIEDWDLTKGNKKKKRQSTFADIAEPTVSAEASANPTFITECEHSKEKALFATAQEDIVTSVQPDSPGEARRPNFNPISTESKSIDDAGRQTETLVEAAPAKDHTVTENREPEATKAEDSLTLPSAGIEESDSQKLQSIDRIVAHVPTTTPLPKESRADVATVVIDSPGASEDCGISIITDRVEEAPTLVETQQAHGEESSTPDTLLAIENKPAGIAKENLLETPLATTDAGLHFEELAPAATAMPPEDEKPQFQGPLQADAPTSLHDKHHEAETISTSRVPSAIPDVNLQIEDIAEDGTWSPQPEKNKKNRRATYEEPITESQQTENGGPEAKVEEAETELVPEPAVINSLDQPPTAASMSDTVTDEGMITSAAKPKKDKKKKRKTLSAGDEVNEQRQTVQDGIGKVQEETASEARPKTEAPAELIDKAALELEVKPNVAGEAVEKVAETCLAVVEPTGDVSSGPAKEGQKVMQTSPSAADEIDAVGEHDMPSLGGETASTPELQSGIPDGTTGNMREAIPVVEEPEIITSESSASKSKKEKKKSKRKSPSAEEPEVGGVGRPRTENEIDTGRDDAPGAQSKSLSKSKIDARQHEIEGAVSSKRSKKKGKNSKVLAASDDYWTPGTATPKSNEEFASAMQTPIQRTTSPELMDYVKAEEMPIPAPAPETDTADYSAQTPSKKKIKKDKKKKSFFAWMGADDQITEDTSGISTPAPLPEPEMTESREDLESAALTGESGTYNAKKEPETLAVPAESEVMKTGETLEPTSPVVEQEPVRSENYIVLGATTAEPEGPRSEDTHELTVPSPRPEVTPDRHTLGKEHDLPREINIDPAKSTFNIGEASSDGAMDMPRISDFPGVTPVAESEKDRRSSLRDPDDFPKKDEHAGLVTTSSEVPETSDRQREVFDTISITPEEESTAAEPNEEEAVIPATIATSKNMDVGKGPHETDFGVTRNTSKSKKSKKNKAKKKSSVVSGTEDIEPTKMGLGRTEDSMEETWEPGVNESVPEQGMEISHIPEMLPGNAEDLSDVSTTTRERRKRRRSPPAWAGEEPEDLPRDRALTPPPEHDDIMDTALGVAAGLGFGAGENEPTREPLPKPPSPSWQPSAGWSFTKLGPITNLAHADSNRDSGVQFESPILSTGQFTSQRDSGFIPSPGVQHGDFGGLRNSNTEMNLRPPRPQSPTSSTEDVSKVVTSRKNIDQPASLETPRRRPSPVESTSKDRSSVLFNSSPAMPSPLNTDVYTRSPQPVASPLRRSPSIHGHHHSREELRQQKAKISPHHEDSDQLASNLIDRSAAAPVSRSAFDSHSYGNINRPYSPGKSPLNAINEDSTEPTSKAHPFSDPPTSLTPRHAAENDSLASAGLVAAAGAAAFAAACIQSRDSPVPGAKSLGRSKSRTSSLRNLRSASISPYDPANFASGSSQGPVNSQNAGRAAIHEREMAEVYDGYGSYPGSPRSPTRPPSIRQRQSMHQIRDLEAKLDQLASENRALAEAKIVTEQQLEQAHFERNRSENITVGFNAQIQERDAEIARLKQEVASLIATHESLKKEHEQSLVSFRQDYDEAQSHWQDSLKELETLRSRHNELSTGMESIVRHEIDTALTEKNAEIQRLRGDLEAAREKIRELQSQILSRRADDVVVFHDEDYFDQACQKLCQQVQGWVLRFSKFSDLKLCRTTSEVRDEKIVDRFDNAILDGSDVDDYLADRVKRRDVFMSVVMTMIWEYVFTRYLFGMDRDQRQKLKQLEKNLGEVGPSSAVHQWRALTLTLLSKRESFKAQRESDTEAVAIEIFSTLSRFLPPPQHLEEQIVGSLRNVMRTAVELSIEMRTQRAEYIMLPPLQPEYDTNGDLARKVYFNASLMNERSGETTSNEELERDHAVVRMVLFPLVVKKGDDNGVGDEEIVVCPAQVLIARPDKGKRAKGSTRLASGGSDVKSLRAVSTHSLAMSGIEGNENMF
ncbi:uncharacterized protein Z519_00016 [Cladophialophora bantiana CBS 173.52]|uniref:Involucrin repeat protein n=1 Tax=Cladophialophora bantiana (strain ATCC 10958 / CBS 173.52 / CDC B-1940 / NIH 8579) TaxID=1442370 RepID=A0A0D2F8F6_CLAB1|nr:uncharacterized protein Z519_00016 [Cladophialophora bantiana CBS 173.52]KIW98356.1 hypothetical protein Z519_00016 [Cladophialophora bantiana CBS 173.52]